MYGDRCSRWYFCVFLLGEQVSGGGANAPHFLTCMASAPLRPRPAELGQKRLDWTGIRHACVDRRGMEGYREPAPRKYGMPRSSLFSKLGLRHDAALSVIGRLSRRTVIRRAVTLLFTYLRSIYFSTWSHLCLKACSHRRRLNLLQNQFAVFEELKSNSDTPA